MPTEVMRIECSQCARSFEAKEHHGFVEPPPGWLVKVSEDDLVAVCSTACAASSEEARRVYGENVRRLRPERMYSGGPVFWEMRRVAGHWQVLPDRKVIEEWSRRRADHAAAIASARAKGHAIITCQRCGSWEDKGAPPIPGQDDSSFVCGNCDENIDAAVALADLAQK